MEKEKQLILTPLEQYCEDEHVFFNEQDRIQYVLEKGRSVNKEFKRSLERGFQYLREFKDHPNFKNLMLNQDDF